MPLYESWCPYCCMSFHPVMLTGYCLRECHCDKCGKLSDLAMVRTEQPERIKATV